MGAAPHWQKRDKSARKYKKSLKNNGKAIFDERSATGGGILPEFALWSSTAHKFKPPEEEWPRIAATIQRLGLTPKELMAAAKRHASSSKAAKGER